jgi:hypothetical protein
VVESIAATTTKTGLKVESALDTRHYQKGIKVSNAEMKSLNITGHPFHTLILLKHCGFPACAPRPWKAYSGRYRGRADARWQALDEPTIYRAACAFEHRVTVRRCDVGDIA